MHVLSSPVLFFKELWILSVTAKLWYSFGREKRWSGWFLTCHTPSNVREWIAGTKSGGGGLDRVMNMCHLRIICVDYPLVKGKFKLDIQDFLKMEEIICWIWPKVRWKVEMWHSNPYPVSSQLFVSCFLGSPSAAGLWRLNWEKCNNLHFMSEVKS